MTPAVRLALRSSLVGIIHAAQGALALLSDGQEGEGGQEGDSAETTALAKIRRHSEDRTFGDDYKETDRG